MVEATPNGEEDAVEKPAWTSAARYTFAVTLVALAFLVGIFLWIEVKHPQGEIPQLSPLLGLVLSAGALGGCLFNIHCLVKHVDAGDFDSKRNLGYYFSPLSGAVCGLVVVILLLGGVLTLGLGQQASRVVLEHPGRFMPFVALAVIAGYGSRQFKHKLDELVETLFTTEKQGRRRSK